MDFVGAAAASLTLFATSVQNFNFIISVEHIIFIMRSSSCFLFLLEPVAFFKLGNVSGIMHFFPQRRQLLLQLLNSFLKDSLMLNELLVRLEQLLVFLQGVIFSILQNFLDLFLDNLVEVGDVRLKLLELRPVPIFVLLGEQVHLGHFFQLVFQLLVDVSVARHHLPQFLNF